MGVTGGAISHLNLPRKEGGSYFRSNDKKAAHFRNNDRVVVGMLRPAALRLKDAGPKHLSRLL